MDSLVGGVEASALTVGAVSRDGPTFAARGDVGSVPVDRSTVMYAASITKQLVGYLVAEASLRGALSPDDPLLTRLPELPVRFGAVRLGHLLHHTGDLPEVTASAPIPGDNAEVMRRLIRPSARTPEPGRAFAYSNTGYVLLAEVLARTSGTPVDELARRRIFGPLGMTGSRIGGPPLHLDGEPDPPGTIGDGGLWTTTEDLLRWLDALHSGLLDPAAVRLMETRTAYGAPGSEYAWGVVVSATSRGRRVTHGGSWFGRSGKTVRLPDRGVAVAVLGVGADDAAISLLGLELADEAADRADG